MVGSHSRVGDVKLRQQSHFLYSVPKDAEEAWN